MTASTTFAGLGLAPSLLASLAARGYEAPLPVQAAAIPPGLEGRDLLVQSRTGSGKTLAFGLPLLQRLTEAAHPQALVLAPTRELAEQVASELRRFRAVDVALLVGGLGYGPQLRALEKGSPVVVGTPGRVKDHLERGTLQLGQLAMVVLDECDEMLNMGFLEDVEAILAQAPKGPQTFLFSATLPPPIARLAERFLKNPLRLDLGGEGQPTAHADIAHTPVQAPDHLQVKALVNLLLNDAPSAALIFTKTKIHSEEVAEELTASGLPAAFLHGDLHQGTRARILEQFKRGQLRYLVATDVAARGLDITGLPLVVHLGIPTQVEGYIHRSGRTGRAGAKGTSLALVNTKEGRILQAWSRRGAFSLSWRGVPGPDEIRTARGTRLRSRILEGGEACLEQARALLADLEPEHLVAGLLALVQTSESEGFDLRLPAEAPKPWRPRPEGAPERPARPWSKRPEGDRPKPPFRKDDRPGGWKERPRSAKPAPGSVKPWNKKKKD